MVITGDLVDGRVADLRAEVAPLGDLRAKHGVFFVTGNHEYYSGVDDWLAELRRLGVRPLRNERVSIGEGEHSFDLAGVDDWSARRFGGDHGPDLARALAGRDPSAASWCSSPTSPSRSTRPRSAASASSSAATPTAGRSSPGASSSGSTSPTSPASPGTARPHLYVSRGTGFWGPPMRVGAPAGDLRDRAGQGLTSPVRTLVSSGGSRLKMRAPSSGARKGLTT